MGGTYGVTTRQLPKGRRSHLRLDELGVSVGHQPAIAIGHDALLIGAEGVTERVIAAPAPEPAVRALVSLAMPCRATTIG